MSDINDTKVMRRLLKRVKEANLRYISIDDIAIKDAMAAAFKEYLNTCFGTTNILFDAYWKNDESIKITAYNLLSYIEKPFDLGALSELRIREILALFNKHLDNAEALKDNELLKNLCGGLIYGHVVRFDDDMATVVFFDSKGNERYGFCKKRDLLPKERDSDILMRSPLLPFMVKSVGYSFNKLRLDLRLTRLSIKIPELLISESLQENGFNINNYHFKCVRRIGGSISLVGSIDFLPKSVIQDVCSKLGSEYLRVYAFKKNTTIAKSIIAGDKTWLSALSKYFNISTVKRFPKKNISQKYTKEPDATIKYTSGSFMDKIIKNGEKG